MKYNETTFFRYYRDIHGRLVQVDVAKRNRKLVPRFSASIEDVGPFDEQAPHDPTRLDRWCHHLTPTERRRWLSAACDGKSISEIATVEQVSRQAIIDGFHRMADRNGFVALWLLNKNRKNQYE